MLRSDQKLVFIGGLHRSGTSLLHRMMQEHPDVSGFSNTGVPEDEGQHLQGVYPPAKLFGGAGKFCFDPEARLNEASPLVDNNNTNQLWRQWSRFWDLDKAVLVEKSPPNLIRTRFLQALFPEAYFVVVVRHPVSVAFATQKWSHTTIPSLLLHWQHAYRIFLKDKASLNRIHIIRYEDLVACPEEVLGNLYRFLGISTYATGQSVSADVDKKYMLQWEEYRENHPFISRVAALRVTLAKQFGYSWN